MEQSSRGLAPAFSRELPGDCSEGRTSRRAARRQLGRSPGHMAELHRDRTPVVHPTPHEVPGLHGAARDGAGARAADRPQRISVNSQHGAHLVPVAVVPQKPTGFRGLDVAPGPPVADGETWPPSLVPSGTSVRPQRFGLRGDQFGGPALRSPPLGPLPCRRLRRLQHARRRRCLTAPQHVRRRTGHIFPTGQEPFPPAETQRSNAERQQAFHLLHAPFTNFGVDTCMTSRTGSAMWAI